MTELVWIRSTVEAGMEVDEDFIAIPRDEWEAMTPERQSAYLTDIAVTHQNNFAPCGASVVEEDEVPSDLLEGEGA